MYPLTVLEAGSLKASVSVSSPLHTSHWYRAHLKFTMVTSQDSSLITAAKTYFQRRSHSEIPNGYEFRGHYPTPYTTLSTIPWRRPQTPTPWIGHSSDGEKTTQGQSSASNSRTLTLCPPLHDAICVRAWHPMPAQGAGPWGDVVKAWRPGEAWSQNTQALLILRECFPSLGLFAHF